MPQTVSLGSAEGPSNAVHARVGGWWGREHYRPPVTHAVSTDKEKNRLNEVFTHKGGKALPDELLHPVGTREGGRAACHDQARACSP